ncbi:MAG TPA: YkgJ family cysteine cluster protein [Nannocystaceae bacterium]|nr:YkgJ family cysteine cluster protein [Nannocystaceae bacterium]
MSAADDARAALVTLRRRVGDHFAAAQARSPDAMQCRSGCADCCRVRFGVFGVEAEPIALALAELGRRDPQMRARVRAQADDPRHGACALLVDDRCTVYDARPLICRSHGLAVRVRDEAGGARIDCCPLNYRETDAPAPSVLELAAVEAPLSVIARMYEPAAERVELAALARATDD